jgi:hypothetical protein
MHPQPIVKRCKECLELKTWVFSGKKYGKDSVFVDEAQRPWKGKTCSKCVATYARRKYRKQRGLPESAQAFVIRNKDGKFIKRKLCAV